jgi:Protein of unknown function (DUF2591)
MQIAIGRLFGKPLDWAVAHALGKVRKDAQITGDTRLDGYWVFAPHCGHWVPLADFLPSTDFAHGSRILHEHRISIHYCVDLADSNGLYIHAEPFQRKDASGYWFGGHDHPLVAGCRSLVALELNATRHDTIEVPDDLWEGAA